MSQASAPRRRRGRLSRSGDFDNAVRKGSSAANRHMVVYAFDRSGERSAEPRLGLAVSRKIGGAVVRNRLKRVLREEFAERVGELRPGVDIVVIARPGLAEYLDERGSAALGERLGELAMKVAGPTGDTGGDAGPRLED